MDDVPIYVLWVGLYGQTAVRVYYLLADDLRGPCWCCMGPSLVFRHLFHCGATVVVAPSSVHIWADGAGGVPSGSLGRGGRRGCPFYCSPMIMTSCFLAWWLVTGAVRLVPSFQLCMLKTPWCTPGVSVRLILAPLGSFFSSVWCRHLQLVIPLEVVPSMQCHR